MQTSQQVSEALDAMFKQPQGLYGSFDTIPVISQFGHARRVELLDRLNVGDVKPMTCVDFGMGSWAFGSVYGRLHGCARAIGMDISNTAIDLSRRLVAETRPTYADVFETYQSDGMEIPLPDASVDLFFSGESIEHVRFPPRYLAEIYRVLKADGQVVITTPNKAAIKYRERGEEYCTSPEHFWLFDHDELVGMVSEFFDIKEIYGFNGSLGSHEEDRETVDRTETERWSRMFENEPANATGIVLRAVKRPGVATNYVVEDIVAAKVTAVGSDTYLPLEFGLKGLLLSDPAQTVTIERPPSDGMVCRFWSHLWSGIASVAQEHRVGEIDLYTKVPGWQNWVSRERTSTPSTIVVTPTGSRNERALASQVIFYEAFVWFRRDREGRELAAALPSPQAGSRGPSYQAGYGFARFQPFVGTTVFHWFGPTEGNVRGPWQPVGGRQVWDGTVEFWKRQIHEMMLANIDAIYLHLIPTYESYRVNFFKAYGHLRRMGWDVPKIAPFLDPFGIWREAPIDLATDEGKEIFVGEYIRFFDQYFAENDDEQAASFLLMVDGRLCISTWWVSLLRNVQALTRDDVEFRLRARFASRIPQLAQGIYTMTTALIDPDLTFSDERMVMFSGYAYAIHSVHKDVDVWHVQAGYWDQNIRSPGYLMPRDGGKNYRRAWDIVAANMPYVGRVYIESWNEYDEGSGIYAADPGGPFVDPAQHTNTDTFSDRGDPYEYVLTTAEGAAKINGRPAKAGQILASQMQRENAGQRSILHAWVRNEGNVRWLSTSAPSLRLTAGGASRSVSLADSWVDASPLGVVRGEVVLVTVAIEESEADGLVLQLHDGETTLGAEAAALPNG